LCITLNSELENNKEEEEEEQEEEEEEEEEALDTLTTRGATSERRGKTLKRIKDSCMKRPESAGQNLAVAV